uniref:15-hydroxyprostaglandin dehydrogenase [NAD(+)] n=1 Tax=Saccoglossus kowalevskii TaxID=10224 RepID=A0ABM0MH70_SACKO|nr:PREDICTED: 15-hydroxyprostaglandin dehydrogenase [NAD(+)]-like [Saccoglossus kowalevskii]
MSEINGKVAIITGGADGIGEALADDFLNRQAKGVYIIDINEKKGQETLNTLKNKHGAGRIQFRKCDVRYTDLLEAAFKDCMDQYGQLDVVCNNAGIFNEYTRKLTIDVNLAAVIEGTYLAVKYMGTQNGGKGGVVVNTASIYGLCPQKLSTVYAASKHGVVGFTRSVAFEPDVVSNGVRVVAICPDAVDTTLVPIASEIGVKYTKEIKQFTAGRPLLKLNDVTSTVVHLIEDGSANGTTRLIRVGLACGRGTLINNLIYDPVKPVQITYL